MIKRIINWLSYEPEVKPPSEDRLLAIVKSLMKSSYAKVEEMDDGTHVSLDFEKIDLRLGYIHYPPTLSSWGGYIYFVKYKGLMVYEYINGQTKFYEKGQWAISLENAYNGVIHGTVD